MNLVDKWERTVAGVGIGRVVRSLKNSDREKALLDLTNLGQRLSRGMFQDKTFDKIRQVIKEPNGKWMQFLYRVMDESDAHVMKTMTWNLGYTALFQGTRLIRRSREKYGCNIPWGMLIMASETPKEEMLFNGTYEGCGENCQLSYEHMDKIVTQGKALGIYFYSFISYDVRSRAQDLLRLAKTHNDCEFNLFGAGLNLDKAFIRKMVELGNITVSMAMRGCEEAMDGQFGQGAWDKSLAVMDYMKLQGVIFGVESIYTADNYREVTDDRFLDTIISHGARFIWYTDACELGLNLKKECIPDDLRKKEILDRIGDIRSGNGGKSIYAIDFLKDAAVVEGHTAGGMSYCLINARGEMVLNPRDTESPCFDLTRHSLLEGLRQMEQEKNRCINKEKIA